MKRKLEHKPKKITITKEQIKAMLKYLNEKDGTALEFDHDTIDVQLESFTQRQNKIQ